MTIVERARLLAESDAFIHAPVAYSIIDLHGHQLAANPAFHQLFGVDDGPLRVEDITHPEEMERTAAYLDALASGARDRVVVDKRYLRTDGGTFWGRLTATPLLDTDQRPELLLGVIEDVTAHMETLGQLTAVSHAKSHFVARVSHDLRTPLHAISGLAELLSLADLAPENRGFADAISREAEALRALVDDLLDLSRVEAGRLELNRAAFPLGVCIRLAVDLLQRRADERGIDLGVTIAHEIDRNVWGDADRLRQVIVNLVDNAIKFTAEGSVHVTVRPEPGNDVTIEVRDTGLGIEAHHIDRIFEPFGQTHDDQSGTGLGLSISRELSEIMGGSLTVDSAPGRGSTFTVRLPLPRAVVDDAPDLVNPVEIAGDPRQPKVLVVEDSPVNRLLVTSQLDHLGYRHILAADGGQALDAVRRGGFDLVLMDWHLPDMDGLETTRRLRAIEAEDGRAPVPVIAVTARTMSGDRERCLEAGMDDFLPKPVGLDDLGEMLRRWLPADADERIDAVTATATAATSTDVAAIERLIDELGDPSIVATLVTTFLTELPGRRGAITDGAATGDHEQVRRAAHTLKSTSAVLGARGLAATSAELETRARSGDDDLGPLIRELDRAADRATSDFMSILTRLEDG